MLHLRKIRGANSRASRVWATNSSARQFNLAAGVMKLGCEKMGDIATLRPREVVRQDVEAIAVIYRNLGAPVAEQMVSRALGELALTMAGIAEKVRAKELRDMSRQLGRLRRLAADLGLLSLSNVAGDAKSCLERADGTAFSAVWARLLRVAERSLSTEIGLADQSV
jgi:hypothetical protein